MRNCYAVVFAIGVLSIVVPWATTEEPSIFYDHPNLLGERYVDRGNFIGWELTSEAQVPVLATTEFSEAVRYWEKKGPRFVIARQIVSRGRSRADVLQAISLFEQASASTREKEQAVGVYGLLSLYSRFVWLGKNIGAGSASPGEPYGKVFTACSRNMVKCRPLARKYREVFVAYIESELEMPFMTTAWPRLVKSLAQKWGGGYRIVVSSLLLRRDPILHAQGVKDFVSELLSEHNLSWRAKYVFAEALAFQGHRQKSEEMLALIISDSRVPWLWRTKAKEFLAGASVERLGLQIADGRRVRGAL